MAGFKITAVQGMILNFLSFEDRVTSKELGEKTMLDSATLTGILDRLEKVALIERKRHPSDRRAIVICLTEQGREPAKDTFKEAIRANSVFLACLTANEQTLFKSMLDKIRNHLEQALAEI